jgi:hypothetical protein
VNGQVINSNDAMVPSCQKPFLKKKPYSTTWRYDFLAQTAGSIPGPGIPPAFSSIPKIIILSSMRETGFIKSGGT